MSSIKKRSNLLLQSEHKFKTLRLVTKKFKLKKKFETNLEFKKRIELNLLIGQKQGVELDSVCPSQPVQKFSCPFERDKNSSQ